MKKTISDLTRVVDRQKVYAGHLTWKVALQPHQILGLLQEAWCKQGELTGALPPGELTGSALHFAPGLSLKPAFSESDAKYGACGLKKSHPNLTKYCPCCDKRHSSATKVTNPYFFLLSFIPSFSVSFPSFAPFLPSLLPAYLLDYSIFNPWIINHILFPIDPNKYPNKIRLFLMHLPNHSPFIHTEVLSFQASQPPLHRQGCPRRLFQASWSGSHGSAVRMHRRSRSKVFWPLPCSLRPPGIWPPSWASQIWAYCVTNPSWCRRAIIWCCCCGCSGCCCGGDCCSCGGGGGGCGGGRGGVILRSLLLFPLFAQESICGSCQGTHLAAPILYNFQIWIKGIFEDSPTNQPFQAPSRRRLFICPNLVSTL